MRALGFFREGPLPKARCGGRHCPGTATQLNHAARAGASTLQLAWRTSVSSTSVTVTDCSITSTAPVSTVGVAGRTALFTGACLGLPLATARFIAFPRAVLDNFLALGRAVAPFLFWTLDDCFLRLTIIDPPLSLRKRIDTESKRQPAPSPGNPFLRVINR
jgi:hypothetical protein